MNDLNALLFPTLTQPGVAEDHVAEILRKADLDPAFIFAFRETGLLVTVDNEHLISEEDHLAWCAAVEAYRFCEEVKERRGKDRP